jgi:hypothetical protein
MELTDQIHTSAALALGKETQYPLDKKVSGVQDSGWIVWSKKTFLLFEFRLRIVQPVA